MIYVSNTYLQKTVSCVCRVNTYIPQNDLYYADDIHDNYVGDRNGLVKIVETGKSEYYDGPLEGVYVRKEDAMWLNTKTDTRKQTYQNPIVNW